jgi:hypothetical protein
MSAPGAGHEFPRQEVSWQKRDVLLFANSIGIKADELHFLYVSFMAISPNRRSDWCLGTSPELRSVPYLLSHPSYVNHTPDLVISRANIRPIYQHSSSLTKKSPISTAAKRPSTFPECPTSTTALESMASASSQS